LKHKFFLQIQSFAKGMQISMDFGTESLLGACVNLIEATSIFPLKIESNPFLPLIENRPDPSPPCPNLIVLFCFVSGGGWK
jgi:hypothetical protein